MDECAKILCSVSDREMDPRAKALIRKWADPPRALEILQVLDACVYAALTSDFWVKAMDIMLNEACEREKVTRADLLAQATWRRG